MEERELVKGGDGHGHDREGTEGADVVQDCPGRADARRPDQRYRTGPVAGDGVLGGEQAVDVGPSLRRALEDPLLVVVYTRPGRRVLSEGCLIFTTMTSASSGPAVEPYRSDGRSTVRSGNLAELYPDVAAQWHPSRNVLEPAQVGAQSKRKVWWQCPEGHEWEAAVGNRTGHRSGCPYCAGQRAGYGNDLATLRPDVAQEWHPTLNGQLAPSDVRPGSHRKVWWLCARRHEWPAPVKRRTKGHGCPQCSFRRSVPEVVLAVELAELFPGVDPAGETTVGGHRVDVLVPDLSLVFEYDGAHWHRAKAEVDEAKTRRLMAQGYDVVRVRERPLPALEVPHLTVARNPKDMKAVVLGALDTAITVVKDECRSGILLAARQRYASHHGLMAVEQARIIASERHAPADNLVRMIPVLAAEWDIAGNLPMRPEHVTRGTSTKVWWRCRTCHHRWTAAVADRWNGHGCPECKKETLRRLYQQPKPGRSLLAVAPEVAREWHPTLNGELGPADLSVGSSRRVWWLCANGHSYESAVDQRVKVKRPCRSCSSLEYRYPALSAEWHPTLNGDLTPCDVESGSHRKVWWRCPGGHEWLAEVRLRTCRGSGCPVCRLGG